jgi:hypothetical protein
MDAIVKNKDHFSVYKKAILDRAKKAAIKLI